MFVGRLIRKPPISVLACRARRDGRRRPAGSASAHGTDPGGGHHAEGVGLVGELGAEDGEGRGGQRVLFNAMVCVEGHSAPGLVWGSLGARMFRGLIRLPWRHGDPPGPGRTAPAPGRRCAWKPVLGLAARPRNSLAPCVAHWFALPSDERGESDDVARCALACESWFLGASEASGYATRAPGDGGSRQDRGTGWHPCLRSALRPPGLPAPGAQTDLDRVGNGTDTARSSALNDQARAVSLSRWVVALGRLGELLLVDATGPPDARCASRSGSGRGPVFREQRRAVFEAQWRKDGCLGGPPVRSGFGTDC